MRNELLITVLIQKDGVLTSEKIHTKGDTSLLGVAERDAGEFWLDGFKRMEDNSEITINFVDENTGKVKLINITCEDY